MKVQCKLNNILNIEDKNSLERIKQYIHLSDGQLNLEKNKEYCVFGIEFRDNSPWFLICLDEEDECPTAYPSELFELTDESLSSYWRITTNTLNDGSVETSFVFEEWANDPIFYERLVECDPSAIEIFNKYRNKILAE